LLAEFETINDGTTYPLFTIHRTKVLELKYICKLLSKYIKIKIYKFKVKQSHYTPGQALRVTGG